MYFIKLQVENISINVDSLIQVKDGVCTYLRWNW